MRYVNRFLLAGFAMGGLAACGNGPSLTPTPSGEHLTLGSGALFNATIDSAVSSRNDRVGTTFTATVSSDVKDDQGRVVVRAGSTLNLSITELEAANDKGTADGRITMMVNSVTVGDQTYPISATITAMEHTLKGRGVGAAEVEKTAAGVVIGGIAGRVIGGNTKGTIIGAVVGGAAGAVLAAQTANRDVVVAVGTPMVVTLNGPVTIAVR